MKYDCPHCGKFSLRTFCEHCGKPTESLWKYRIMYLISLVAIPSVAYYCHNEFQKALPELVAMEAVEVNFATLFAMVFLVAIGFAIFSMFFIIWQWVRIESQFHEYNKKHEKHKTPYTR